MPYLQPWVDPNTGATYPQSYVRVITARADPSLNVAGFFAARWAGQDAYSQGMQPVQTRELHAAGVAYATFWGSPVAAAVASYNQAVLNGADAYVGGLPTMSGATPAGW